MKRNDAEKKAKQSPVGLWQYLDPNPDQHLAWSILYGCLMLALGVVLIGFLASCGTATRVVTPVPPPEEAPDTGVHVELTVTGQWNGQSLANARCAVSWSLKDEQGRYHLASPEWGCTAGTDEDLPLAAETE